MFPLVLTIALSFLPLTNAYSPRDAPNALNRAQSTQTQPNTPTAPITLANATFTQLIDHKNPSLGTFEQFYYYSAQYWAGPGSPIVLFTPGEVNVSCCTDYATLNYTSGVLAQKLGAAVVIVEHRYLGLSSPFAHLSTDNLRFLTLENAIRDFVRFAREVRLPFAGTAGGANATTAPWIFFGQSYSGALAAWIEHIAGGTFWAYWSSSGPVNAMEFWQYFVPIQRYMPKNCSADLTRVVDHVDHVGLNGTVEEQKALQKMFGLEEIVHYDDFAATFLLGPWSWQGNQFDSNSGFYTFCDTIEGIPQNQTQNQTSQNITLPPETGIGLALALPNYAKWMSHSFLPGFCESFHYPEWTGRNNVACLETYDTKSPYYTDWSLSNKFSRQWTWLTCNEPFGYWPTATPPDRPSIVPRLVNRAYWERQCALWFPTSPSGRTYGIAAGKTYEAQNAYTGGWSVTNSTRLLHVNGEFDPWREAGVSSDFRPGGPLASTARVPVFVVPGGFHASEITTLNGVVNRGCRDVIDKVIGTLEEWVGEWKGRGTG
ncbi:hypothetical protein Vi05172_g6642 [Venturia inaequalis]|nr:hypothetical protein Vi05172_g6642 [Venturia inaequalis]